jgi:hypothetical protein
MDAFIAFASSRPEVALALAVVVCGSAVLCVVFVAWSFVRILHGHPPVLRPLPPEGQRCNSEFSATGTCVKSCRTSQECEQAVRDHNRAHQPG